MSQKRMKIGVFDVLGSVITEGGLTNRRVRDFDFFTPNETTTSLVELNSDDVSIQCRRITDKSTKDRSPLYVNITIEGVRVQIYRVGNELIILPLLGKMKPAGRSHGPAFMVSPHKPKERK